MTVGNAINLALLCNMDPGKQEDAQEFLLRFFEKLEDALGRDESPTNIFAGEMTQYIRCKNINVIKERKERFYDISINVVDNCDLQQALDSFFKPVILEGDNQYRTKMHGLQDALKGQSISRLPKVLFVHLKRFEYDIETNRMRKIAKAIKFPMKLSLDRYLAFGTKNQFTTAGSPASIYKLNAVIVHDGNGSAGHYTCFARTSDSKDCDTWYRLNDNMFHEVDIDTVIMESVGADFEIHNNDDGVSQNAYILQYIISDSA